MRTCLSPVFALLSLSACAIPTANDGPDTGSETGQPGDGDGDGDGEACVGGGPTIASMTIEADTWPRTQDDVTGVDEATLDAVCTLVGGTTTSLSVVCDDPEGSQHSVTILWSGPFFDFSGISKMHVRWILDSWWDVTMVGSGEWVRLAIPETGELVAAGMSGHAEFLGLLPNDGVADDWYAPLELAPGYGVCAQGGDAIVVTPVDGPPVYVAAPGSASVDGDVAYDVRVSAFSAEDQGPENPSVSTFGLVIARTN